MSPTHLLRRGVTAIAGGALLFAGLVATAPLAAADVTVTDPASGASITLSSNEISPGERIQIKGTGFVAQTGTKGDPLVAVRPYDYDDGPAWTVGGPDAYTPPNTTEPPGSEAKYWFVTDHADNGSFEGWIQAPSNLTKAGPLGNGSHWLRILSGAFFTTTGDRLTEPITFKVPFTVVDKVTLGLTTNAIFQEGTTFRPGASMTVRGRNFTPSTAVSVALDGNALDSSITTDENGAFPGTARVTLPADLQVGNHTLRVATGAVSETVQIKVTPVPTAKVLTERVRPGGTVAFDLTGYIGVGGKPQKVAVVVNEEVLACIEADSNGAAGDVATLPDDLTSPVSVGFNVGLSCILPPTGVINDQPISRSVSTVSVSDDAPEVVVDDAALGGNVTLSGSGFAANAAVDITIGSTKVGTLTADNAGAISGTVPAPRTAGTYRILANDGSNAAAAKVTVDKQSAALTLTAPTPLTYGAARSTTVGLKVGGQASGGKVTLSQGKWSTTVTVPTSGSLKVSLPRDSAVGKHTVTATLAASNSSTGAEASRTFTVGKAASSASLKVSPKKVKKSKRATATVRVTVNGASQIAATGKVTIYDGSKKLASTTLKSSHKGTVKVKLPKIKKKGTHKLKVSYAGTSNISAKTSATVKLKVV